MPLSKTLDPEIAPLIQKDLAPGEQALWVWKKTKYIVINEYGGASEIPMPRGEFSIRVLTPSNLRLYSFRKSLRKGVVKTCKGCIPLSSCLSVGVQTPANGTGFFARLHARSRGEFSAFTIHLKNGDQRSPEVDYRMRSSASGTSGELSCRRIEPKQECCF